MQTVTLAEAQARLPELIGALAKEEEIVITQNDQTVAVLLPKTASPGTAEIASRADHKEEKALGLKTFSVGKVLKPEFNRAEVWDEMIAR